MELVSILLRYIRAERTSNWELHLSSVTEMLPFFFAFDHFNYARWVIVYLADMHMLPQTAPDIYQEFIIGSHTVQRSKNSFSSVWSHMGLEQTLNKHCKTQGGLVGFSTKPSSVDRWFLTAHERATITSCTDQMLGINESRSGIKHKETGSSRNHCYEYDVQKIISTISSKSNPFDISKLVPNDQQPLINIAT